MGNFENMLGNIGVIWHLIGYKLAGFTSSAFRTHDQVELRFGAGNF
jgi:hypothetical protein